MSVEYNIYVDALRYPDIGKLSTLCTESPPLADFEDGPFTIRVLRDRDHRLERFTVVHEGLLMDGDTVAGCMRPDADNMDGLLASPVEKAIDTFFGSTSGAGIAPVSMSEFDFQSEYEGEDASDYIESQDPNSIRALETAKAMVSVLSSGEGWFQMILSHVLAFHLQGLFVDPQSGDSKLYR